MTGQHVLVPIDFSPYAEQALDYAITLATKLQARVTLLHVIQPPLIAGAGMGVWPSPTFLEELEAAVTSDMEGYLARVTAAGLEGEIVVVHGVPFQEILHTAKERGSATPNRGEVIRSLKHTGPTCTLSHGIAKLHLEERHDGPSTSILSQPRLLR